MKNLTKRLRQACRFLRRTDGMSAVESAILIPPLLLMFSGVIDFGNLYLKKNLVAEAAREGARIAATKKTGTPPAPPTQSSLQTTIRTEYANNDLSVTMTPSTPATGSSVTVTASLVVDIMTPGIKTFFVTEGNPSGNPTVTEKCVMQVE
jgi:uncharacterized membrane protein